MKKDILPFLGIWTIFLLNGLSHALLLPMWGGFDEWLHYGYTAYLSRTGKVPALSETSIPREVAESVKTKSGTNDFSSPFVEASWQAQHPPLYYFILSPVYRLTDGWPIFRTLKMMRFLSILLASLGLIPAYFILRMFLEKGFALSGLLLICVFPSTFILLGHMTNDTLAFPLLTTLVWLTLKALRDGPSVSGSLLLGLVMGAGILAKIYVLTALPAVFLAYAFRKSFSLFALTLLAAMAVSGPWIAFNLSHYGTWNPAVHSVLSKDAGILDKLKTAGEIDWKSFAFSNLIGLLWAGDWDFAAFPSWVYKLFAVGLLGLLAGLARSWPGLKREKRLDSFRVLITLSLGFLLGLVQHQIQIRSAGNFDTMGGWYWTALLPSHTAMALLALKGLAEGRFNRVLPIILLLVFGLTLWGNIGIQLPHYGGLKSALLPALWALEAGLFGGLLWYINRLES